MTLDKNRLLIDGAYPDAVFGRVACNCGSPDCDISFVVEHDDLGVYSLNFSKTVKALSHDTWLKQAWWRIKKALQILFTGQIEASNDFILDEANLDAFSLLVNETQDRIWHSKNKD